MELSRVHFKRITPISLRCATYEQKEVTVDNYINTHVTEFQELKIHISICHLNMQSVTSTFDEFQCMIDELKFESITLSGTWLKKDKHLLELCQFACLQILLQKQRREKR